MLEWVLWIMVACGPGCLDITVRSYADKSECVKAQVSGTEVLAICVKRATI